METPLLIALVAVGVAGLAAVIAIWMERDPRRPPRWAWSLSILILMATGVSMFQSYLDSREAARMEEDMARMLQQLDRIAAGSDDTALAAFVSTELSAQARANPDMIEMVAQRVADEGGDPAEMLSKHMKASDVENIARDGKLKTKPKATSTKAEEPVKKEPVRIEIGAAGGGDVKVEPAAKGPIMIGGDRDAGPGAGRPALLLGGGGDGEPAGGGLLLRPGGGEEAAGEGGKASPGGISLGGTAPDKAEVPAKKPRPGGGLSIPSGGGGKSGASTPAKIGGR